MSSDQATFKGRIIRGQTTRLTEEVKVWKLFPQWMGLDEIVYYCATTTNDCEHLYQIWTKIILSKESEDLQCTLTYGQKFCLVDICDEIKNQHWKFLKIL